MKEKKLAENTVMKIAICEKESIIYGVLKKKMPSILGKEAEDKFKASHGCFGQ